MIASHAFLSSISFAKKVYEARLVRYTKEKDPEAEQCPGGVVELVMEPAEL